MTRSPRILMAAALVLACLTVPATRIATAQEDDPEVTKMAKEHYKAGLEAYKNGQYEQAIKSLKKAYLLKRLPALLLNIGATYRKMNDFDLALHFYQKYLNEAPPDAKDRGEVAKIITEIQQEKASGGAHNDAEAAPAPAETRRTEPAPTGPAPPTRAEAGATEWSHAIIDAAPPETPVDVRVQMPVMRGVKVYVYYRVAGEEEFQEVLMKRRGGEKVGRIPAEAMTGKSVQYYIEAKDPAGTIVRSSGNSASPNVIMIDPDAPPQMVASATPRREDDGERRSAERETVDTDSGEEPPPPAKVKKKRDLDEEEAPVLAEEEDDRPRTEKKERARDRGTGRKLGKVFWAGVGVAALGLAATGVAIAGGLISQDKSDYVTRNSTGSDADGNPIYFNNDPIATNNGYAQEYSYQNDGKLWNDIGIACAAVGGVALVGGAVMMAIDQLVLNAPPKPKKKALPKKKRRVVVEEDEYSSAPRWYVAPAASPTQAGLGAGFTF